MSTEETQPIIEATEATPEATPEPATPTTPAIVMIDTEEGGAPEGRNERKTRVGVVTSDKMDKTIAVSVERRLQHPIYGKYVKKNKKFIAHDEKNECGIGDTVRIQETRPLSRRKRWRLIEVLAKAK